MNAVLAAVIQELEAALAVCERRATFLQVLYSDSTTTLIPLPCSNGSMPADKASAADGRSVPELTPREKAVLAVLAKADQPLKGRTVATRAGLRYTSHFREMMAELVLKELVIVAPEGGYWPKGRPLPSAGDR